MLSTLARQPSATLTPTPAFSEDGGTAYDPGSVRPGTAIVILILLAVIAIAGIIQLWVLFSSTS